MPYGAFNGLITVALPYILRQHGLTVERISAVSATVQVPAIWYFLWAPVVDIKLRRRTWVLMLSIGSGLCTAVALRAPEAQSIRPLIALLVAASVLNQPISSAVGGLVAAVVPDDRRGRTAGWSQAGILGGGIVVGGMVVWLSDRVAPVVLGVAAGAAIMIPALSVLGVDEPHESRNDRMRHVVAIGRDLIASLRHRDVWIGLALFITPLGAGALMNLFSAVASDFHASETGVIAVIGIAGLLTPAGALVGGCLCDRYDRRFMYAIGGLVTAATTAGMLICPPTPATYLIGAGAYAFATGLAYAAFMSLAYSLLGAGHAASGSLFTVFMAAVNLPVVYMVRLDGLGHAHGGVRGMLLVDTVANAAFAIPLLILMTMRARAVDRR